MVTFGSSMVIFFYQICPKFRITGSRYFLQKKSGCLIVQRKLVPYAQTRSYTKKGDADKAPEKEEEMNVKLPGFVHPETMNEEGYFTQKAKKQLEELKRKMEKPEIGTPEKKI